MLIHKLDSKKWQHRTKITPDLRQKAFCGDDESQYQLGVLYWINKDYAKAEYWLRYAALKGNTVAQKFLLEGAGLDDADDDYKDFLTARQRIGVLAIGILESLITPVPTEQQIADLEQFLFEYLKGYFHVKLEAV